MRPNLNTSHVCSRHHRLLLPPQAPGKAGRGRETHRVCHSASMLFRNSRFCAGDNWFIFTSLRCRTSRAPGETEECFFCDPALTALATHFCWFLRQRNIDSNLIISLFLNRNARGSMLRPRLGQLWRLVKQVHRFFFSCRHDFSLPPVVLHQCLH